MSPMSRVSPSASTPYPKPIQFPIRHVIGLTRKSYGYINLIKR